MPLENFMGHVGNIGRLVEDMEIKMRTAISEIYFTKTRDILNELRSTTDLNVVNSQNAMQAQLLTRLQQRNNSISKH
jgi:capping protein beta